MNFMLAAGTQFGPYEIVGLVGAGGMGEVYRAKDTRLGRDVAIKVLPISFSANTDRLRRFEQEARTAGMLNHPNVLTIHDIGTHDGSPYIVSELLEGATLRKHLNDGPLSQRKALDYALQISSGLASAHEKGIIHRDLKPENIFVTKDGRGKILDFGLAKLTHPTETSSEHSQLATVASPTEAGVVLGTVGYMSPEQVRGLAADHRTDIFALGAILYEMLTGYRAFHRETPAETMTAILKEEPSPLPDSISPGLIRLVNHCLEKDPEHRFQSVRDLSFDLETFSSGSAASRTTALTAIKIKRKLWLRIATGALLLLAILAAFHIGRRTVKTTQVSTPSFRRISFGRGTVYSARFAPDGHTVIYGAAWNGNPIELYSARLESPGAIPLGLKSANVLAISQSGQMAIAMNRKISIGWENYGTLAELALSGGAPRQIVENVVSADWSPDGKDLAVIRIVDGRYQLEYPLGKVLFRASGWMSDCRISPDGQQIAYLEHPYRGDDAGSLFIMNLSGKTRQMTPDSRSIQGVAWQQDGKQIFSTYWKESRPRALYAIDLLGNDRLISSVPGRLRVEDVSNDGKILLSNQHLSRSILAFGPGDSNVRELSWLDYGILTDISPDGKTILISEEGDGGGEGYSTYARSMDGSPAVRLGPGSSKSISPDGKWVLTVIPSTTPWQLVLYPMGPGQTKEIDAGGIYPDWADFVSDEKIIISGSEAGHGTRIYIQNLNQGKPQPITPEGFRFYNNSISPDGKSIVTVGPRNNIAIQPLAGGEARDIPNLQSDYVPTGWSNDGKSIYASLLEEPNLYTIDILTGKTKLIKTLSAPDPTGVGQIGPIAITPDGKYCAYGLRRVLSDLYVVDGVR